MIQEEKQLLLKDLCARLPYGVICHTPKGDGHLCSIDQTIFGTEYGLNINPLKRDYFNDSETDEQIVKPYLRAMSSMTEEEYNSINWNNCRHVVYYDKNGFLFVKIDSFTISVLDWLNANHFDYRDLIEKGLALKASEGMYETK